MQIIDITQSLFEAKVFDGDTAPVATIKQNYCDGYRLTDILMCLHNGTHIDAPSHYIDNNKHIDSVDLSVCMGKCYLLRHNGDIDSTVIENYVPYGTTRLLLDGKCLITTSGAKSIVSSGIKLVGIGRLSVANQENCTEVHTILLQNDIVIIEGLSMRTVEQGEYTLVALPLKLGGCEASPVRAVLIKEDTEQI